MTLLAWLLTLLGLIFMYPWARWLLRDQPRWSLLTALTTLALSVGVLSLSMLWLGLLGIRLDWRLAAIICAVIGGIGWLLPRRPSADRVAADRLSTPWRVIVVVIGMLTGLIVFNAIYWPFGIDDAVTIYAWFGKLTALSGQLPRGSLYETYPMLVPFSYAFIFQASGWINEYLAALIPAILSVGVIGVAYLLGKLLYRREVGLIAALLVALTPMFDHWASTSYVDLPAGFFYGLTAVFLVRLDQDHRWQDALLVGVMAGLAAWTKNSSLLIGGSIAGWIVLLAIRRWPRLVMPNLRHIGLILVGGGAVAGPWYIRNLITARLIIPPTGWIEKAARTVPNLLPYLSDTRYLPIGIAFTVGLLVTVWQFGRSRGQDTAALLLTVFYLPFFAIWWLLVSYDGRFLLILTPIIAVMGAQVVAAILRRIPPRPMLSTLSLIAVLLLALPAASAAVDYKFDLLRHPLMSDADKHRLRLGGRYDMGAYVRTLPANSRIWSQDLLIPYYADGVNVTADNSPEPAGSSQYDYWLFTPGATLPDVLANATPVYMNGGYRLFPAPH